MVCVCVSVCLCVLASVKCCTPNNFHTIEQIYINILIIYNMYNVAFGRSWIQIPWPANLVEVVFSGFLNLKIAKELVIFKDKCRVGPHIPLQKKK